MIINKKGQRIFYYFFILLLFLFSLYKITLGVHGDELHTVALGDMIVSGNSFFKETWFYIQMSTVINAPFIWLFKTITGSADGIVLFLRQVSDIFQLVIAIYFYLTFRDDFDEKYVMLASIIYFIYIPDFRNMLYKVELIWFSLLIICFLYRFVKKRRYVELVAVGICLSLEVLCYPPSAVVLFFVCATLVFLIKRQLCDSNLYKSVGIVVGTCAICGLLFLSYVFATIGIKNFFIFFPIVFKDENVTGNLYSKLIHPIVKVMVFSLFAIIPILLVTKVEFLKSICNKLKLPVVSILFILAFCGQTFIERRCITWHIITYPYALALAFCILLFWNNHSKNTDSIFYIFELMCMGVVISMILASNQGNIACTIGMILAMLLMIIWPSEDSGGTFAETILKEKKVYSIVILVISIFTFAFPVYEWEATNFESIDDISQCSVFTRRELVDYGPLRGLRLGQSFLPQYYSIYDTIINNVEDGEKVLIIGDGLGDTSAGYLSKNITYSTYSPQGGSGIGLSDKIVRYYEYNPDMSPDVVIVNLKYIAESIEDYLCDYAFGEYLVSNGYKGNSYSDEYYILKK